MDFTTWAQHHGIDLSIVSADVKASLQRRWRAEQSGIPFAESVDAGGREEVIDRHLANEIDPQLGTHRPVHATAAAARLAGLDANETELALIRAGRFSGPLVHERSNANPALRNVIEVGLLSQCGVSLNRCASWYGERVVDAATTRNFRAIGLQGLLRETIRAAGGSPPPGRLNDGHIRQAFKASEMMAAGSGLSTIDLDGILGNVANKSMLDAFMDVPVTWRAWCRVGRVNDFKQATRYRLTGIGEFKVVPPGGELKHVSLQEASATAQADTYGAVLGVDRQDFINDDMDALAAVPRAIGRMSAIKVEKSVYELLLANTGSFFASGNANYKSGAGSALADAGLTDAYKAFVTQTDGNGDPTLLIPKVLLCPPDLEVTARKLVVSTNVVGSTTANSLLPDGNPWAGKFELAIAPYLSNANLTGYSTTGWYLLVGPGDFSVQEVVFLNGVEAPTVQQGELNFDRLGYYTRAFFDFGTNQLETRGGVFNVGA